MACTWEYTDPYYGWPPQGGGGWGGGECEECTPYCNGSWFCNSMFGLKWQPAEDIFGEHYVSDNWDQSCEWWHNVLTDCNNPPTPENPDGSDCGEAWGRIPYCIRKCYKATTNPSCNGSNEVGGDPNEYYAANGSNGCFCEVGPRQPNMGYCIWSCSTGFKNCCQGTEQFANTGAPPDEWNFNIYPVGNQIIGPWNPGPMTGEFGESHTDEGYWDGNCSGEAIWIPTEETPPPNRPQKLSKPGIVTKRGGSIKNRRNK